MSIYQVNAVTSVNGSYLSMREQALGMDRHTLSHDGRLERKEKMFKEVENLISTTMGKVLSGEKFLKFDLLARTVIKEEEEVTFSTPCKVGHIGKHKEIQIGSKRFVQIGTDYYGDIS